MTSRRLPLANNPNAANSPFRGPVPIAGKRSRTQTTDQRDELAGQPPSKRQAMDLDNDENLAPRTLTRQSLSQQEAENKLFMKKTAHAPVTALERKLLASREKKFAQKSPDKLKKGTDSLDNIRQWQRHYKRAFPHFVFYFESVPDDIRVKISRQIQQLGAKEEKFFSKSVTHIITTRNIPSDPANTSPDDDFHAPVRLERPQKTIDPSLLNRNQDGHTLAPVNRATNLLNASLESRSYNGMSNDLHVVDPRKVAPHGNDILNKARALNIKIWALEKIQRMMQTMYNAETGEAPATSLPRSHATTNLAVVKPNKQADLQQLLRNEKVIGPADRDMAVAAQDMCQLRGFYVYIHDMDEKTRPVMVRDYPRVTAKEEGKWPQFRLSAVGKCPFMEDTAHARKLIQHEQEKRERDLDPVPRTRSRAAAQPIVPSQHMQPLADIQPNLRRSPRKQQADTLSKPLDPPKTLPMGRQNSADMPALFGSTQANARGLPRFIRGEPVASGVQPSNVTSAIRSQAISSTAISSTAPGARVGSSKEIHALKRKVLERGTSNMSNQTLTSSYMNDVRAALNGDGAPPPRAAKRKAKETLAHIHEEPDEEGLAQQARKKVIVPKELKPGYCENCRDKFEDFDDHIESRKHRKYATDPANWVDLDKLLKQLIRPLRVD